MRKAISSGFTEIERIAIAEQLVVLFAHWDLNQSDALSLLGLQESNPGPMADILEVNILEDDRDVMERAGYLFGIHKNLRLLFPRNRELCYRWMTTSNKAFGDSTPVKVAKEQGVTGLQMVRSYLDSRIAQ